MGESTGIQWTDATWNPVTGCTKVSPGCLHCYAATLDKRFSEAWGRGPHVPWTVAAQRGAAIAQDIKRSKLAAPLLYPSLPGPDRYSPVTLHPDRLEAPLHWRQPRRVFVNSMSDLFHEAVPDEFVERVFAVMAAAKHHTFQVLTKRPERMLKWFASEPLYSRSDMVAGAAWDMKIAEFGVGQKAGHHDPKDCPTTGSCRRCDKHFKIRRVWPGWPLPNVWLGVSVENQRYADERIPLLLQTPAAVRFISAEPLLEPVRLYDEWLTPKLSLDWVIVGGESGLGARPMNLDWARSIVRQCGAASVPCFVKQLGAKPVEPFGWREGLVRVDLRDPKGGNPEEWPAALRVRAFPQPKAPAAVRP